MLKFWTAHGTEETAIILASFTDTQGERHYVVPPSTAAMYDRSPRIISPANVIGDETPAEEQVLAKLAEALEIARENGIDALRIIREDLLNA